MTENDKAKQLFMSHCQVKCITKLASLLTEQILYYSELFYVVYSVYHPYFELFARSMFNTFNRISDLNFSLL